MISQTPDKLTRVFHLELDIKDRAKDMRPEHLQLVDALRKRDPDEAKRLIQTQEARSRQASSRRSCPALVKET